MSKISFEITKTPYGTRLDVTGDLAGATDEAFVARGMVIYARALFVDGRPLLIHGEPSLHDTGGLLNDPWGGTPAFLAADAFGA